MTAIQSARLTKLFSKLIDNAKKSDIMHQHSAVLMYNGAPVAWGFNRISGNKTHHAEHDAIRKFLLSRGMIGWVNQQRVLWGSRICKQREKCAQKRQAIII